MSENRKKRVITFLEDELREYRILKIKLQQLKQARANMKLDTEAAEIWLKNILKNIRACESQIVKIETGLAMCTVEEEELLRNKYFCKPEPNHEKNMMDLCYGNRNTYYRTRDRAFKKMALAYGIRTWNE